ncbi:MAG: nucleoside deaminase [Rhodospirillales bacterium]|nr:nucleoside deaminase [Rhodospirillales bacterium]
MCDHDDKHAEHMAEAARISREKMHAGFGGPFGAVIVKDGLVVGTGFNKVTTDNDPTAHAEVVAIRDACKNLDTFSLKGAVIYTSCEPCPMCLASIYWARLDRVYYANSRYDAARIGFDDEFLYEEIAKEIDKRSLEMVHLPDVIAATAFDEWEAKEDKIAY